MCQPGCTHALGLRLQAAWEAEELRSRSLGLEERARRAEGQTEAERARRLEAERALQSSREREAALQVRRTLASAGFGPASPFTGNTCGCWQALQHLSYQSQAVPCPRAWSACSTDQCA